MFNPGNMRPVGQSSGFQSFDTPEAGMNAMRQDLLAKVSGNSNAMKANFGEGYAPTLRNVISTWAPPTENNTDNYVNFVSQKSGLNPDQPLTTDDVDKIIPHMITMEQGPQGAKQYADAGNVKTDAQVDGPASAQTFNVKLPNGQVLQNIPLGTTKEQIQAKLSAKGISFDKPTLDNKIGSDPTLLQNYGSSVKKYADQVGDQWNTSGNSPYQKDSGPGGDVLQSIGDLGGRVGNIAAGTIGATIMAPIEAGLKTGLNAVIPYAAKGAEALIGDPRFKASNMTPKEKQKLSTDTAELGAQALLAPTKMGPSGDISNVKPAITEITNPIVRKLSDNIGPLVKDESGVKPMKPVAPEPPTSLDIKAASTAKYQEAAANGGVLKPEFTDKFLNEIDAAKPKTELGQMLGKNDPVVKLAEDIAGKRGKPINLDEAQEFDERLGDTIDGLLDGGRMTKAASRVADIQTKFRSMIDNAGESDVAGGKAGFDSLKDARALWSAQAKMRDLEKIVARAEMTDNPATSIKIGFRNLYLNDSKMRGYPDEVKAMVKQAAESGIVGDLLGIAGSRLNPIIATATGAGGVGGAAIAQGASMGARNLRTKVQMGRAQKVSDAIAESVRPNLQTRIPAEKPPEPQKLLSYQPQATDILVNQQGNAREAGPFIQQKLDARRQRLQEIGLTPDVLSLQAKQNTQKLLLKYGQSDLGKFVAENANKPIGEQLFEIPANEYSQAQVNEMLRNSAWDKITTAQKEQIGADIEKAWNKHETSLAEMMMDAKAQAESAAERGKKINYQPLDEKLKVGVANNPNANSNLASALRDAAYERPTLKTKIPKKP